MALSGTTMSLKKIAASTPRRRTGCRVISVMRSVRKHDSSIGMPSRSFAVLRQRAAGLPHEPDRRVRHRLASRGEHQRRRRGAAVAQRVRRGQQVRLADAGGGGGHGLLGHGPDRRTGARRASNPDPRARTGPRRAEGLATSTSAGGARPTLGIVTTRRRDPGADPASVAVPASFAEALASIRAASVRPEVVLEETPAPQRLSPFAVALQAEVVLDDEEAASGRFVLLHDPDGQEPWDGDFRVVTFAKGTVELDIAQDPMLTEVGWAWLVEALDGARRRLPGRVGHRDPHGVGVLRRDLRPLALRRRRDPGVLDPDRHRHRRPPAGLDRRPGPGRGSAPAASGRGRAPAAAPALNLRPATPRPPEPSAYADDAPCTVLPLGRRAGPQIHPIVSGARGKGGSRTVKTTPHPADTHS